MKSLFLLIASTTAAVALNLCAKPPREPAPSAAPPTKEEEHKEGGSSWDKVWAALQAESIPDAAREEGPPVRVGDRLLFRFRAPDAKKAYLAGSFNGFAQNHAGHVSSDRFAMQPLPGGMWYRWVSLGPGTYTYKYVAESENGSQAWLTDPAVQATGSDGNTVLEVPSSDPASAPHDEHATTPARALKMFSSTTEAADAAPLDVRPEKVWVRPGDPNVLIVTADRAGDATEGRLDLQIETPLGEVVCTSTQPWKNGENRVPVPAIAREGGYLAKVTFSTPGGLSAKGEAILPVVHNVADDLRYGFFATYGETADNYEAKAALLARLHINAVEFYDYFPAHGYYAPKESRYRFEPFGIAINAVDIQRKIAAGHERNILSIAYIAAYAASESVYRQFPFPMTDEKGSPKIFNGEIMSEEKAAREGKPKWFWLMNVAGDSPWHAHMMGELRRALDDDPADLVSFDGFEIDTYGDSPDTKFYAQGSRRNGDPLRDVLHDFVRDVGSLTHEVKPGGLVSFNSVNEFGVEQMYDVTDFLFLEIWRFHTDQLGALVDLCVQNRAARRQRVVLKMYPADMQPKQSAWPANALRRVLGAAMTGGGSLMVAGEPDEKTGAMHGLNTMFYPDHQPLPAGNEDLLRAYYRHDAMLLGYTHGRDVFNTDVQVSLPGCIARTFAAPLNRALVVQFLHYGEDSKWSSDAPPPTPMVNQEVSVPLPGGVAPKAVFYASPDVPALQNPARLDFDAVGGTLRTALPELQVHGTLILRY